MEPQICIFTFEITLVCKDFTQKLQVPAYLKIFKGSDCKKKMLTLQILIPFFIFAC